MSDQQRELEAAAEQARFAAFIEGTAADERDWIAFLEFDRAIHDAAGCAAMSNLYDGGREANREHADLKLALGAMLFRVLPRVDLGVLIADAEGIGYAVRFGLIEPKPDALDAVVDTDGYRAMAQKGHDAERADAELRAAAIEAETEES
jgi:hypothetical protein